MSLGRELGVVFLAAMILAACAAPRGGQVEVDPALVEAEARKQRELYVRTKFEETVRVNRVGTPLLVAAARLCAGDVTPRFGFVAANKFQFHEHWRPAAERVLGLTDELKVLYVNPGLAADRAGLRPGDIVLGSGNWRAPRNANALAELERIVRSRESQGGNVPLLLRRGGQEIGVTVNSDMACDYAIVTSDADAVNAFADGRNIIINRGMLRASGSDKELAVVVAHEIGHNAVKHLQAKRSNATAGFIFGAIFDVLAAAAGVNTEGTFAKAGAGAGAQAHSPQYEIEADYVGLYIMARAKYDFSEAPNFWRQMAVLNPRGIAYAGSHPTYPHRFVAMEIGVREIQGKLERGDVIMPDMGPPPDKVEPQPADEENCAAC